MLLILPFVSAPALADVVRASGDDIFSCLSESRQELFRKRFDWEGTCKSRDADSDCSYYDYRKHDLADDSGFDQRGIESFQVTFPVAVDRWAAVSVENDHDERFCWTGGAHVGRNPLAMPWGARAGGKSRRNIFLRAEGGTVQVDGARIHNTHDTFIAPDRDGGFEINHSWISWTRDDFFEGYLHDLTIRDTLVDGVYNFLSDPDSGCSDASDDVIVIENSLIRLQQQPGPHARREDKWHWKVEGGHHNLWKLDSCSWNAWPRFELRDNVFLIEGPGTSHELLDRPRCSHALPGSCDRALERNLAECSNNLFLYTGYSHWREFGLAPGPTPRSGDRFFNPGNPGYRRNGSDCYQRVTDDPRDANYGDVTALWREARARWIYRHIGHGDRTDSVMRIAGVDYPVFGSSQLLRIRNRGSGRCIESVGGGEVEMRSCSDTARQRFRAHAFRDGKLMGAVLLEDLDGRFLRTQRQSILEQDGNDTRLDTRVFAENPPGGTPNFRERWYLLPAEDEPGGRRGTYTIESDALRRSFLRAWGSELSMQRYFKDQERTPLPQAVFSSGDDGALQWFVEKVDG